jgi:hypothetical protein
MKFIPGHDQSIDVILRGICCAFSLAKESSSIMFDHH